MQEELSSKFSGNKAWFTDVQVGTKKMGPEWKFNPVFKIQYPMKNQYNINAWFSYIQYHESGIFINSSFPLLTSGLPNPKGRTRADYHYCLFDFFKK
jgi:hypothetical protein